MREYQVLNYGYMDLQGIIEVNVGCIDGNGGCIDNNGACVGADAGCIGVDDGCGEVNGVCPDVGCPTDDNCACGNTFPCENPNFGCLTGCGGSAWHNCVRPYSIG